MINYLKKVALAGVLALSGVTSSGALEESFDGSWYDPSSPGYGIFVDSNTVSTTIWMFTYETGRESLGDQAKQAWYVTDTLSNDSSVFLLYQPLGYFPGTSVEVGDPVGTISVEGIGERPYAHLVVHWYFDRHGLCDGFSPEPPECSDVSVMVPAVPLGGEGGGVVE